MDFVACFSCLHFTVSLLTEECHVFFCLYMHVCFLSLILFICHDLTTTSKKDVCTHQHSKKLYEWYNTKFINAYRNEYRSL